MHDYVKTLGTVIRKAREEQGLSQASLAEKLGIEVTSMIYRHHGYAELESRELFFGEGVNRDALTYLTLANQIGRAHV